MYKITKQEKNHVEVKFTLTHDEFEAFVEKAYEENKGKFNIQGFRKGKAPRAIIEKNYGATVFYDDAVDMAFTEEYNNFLKAEKDVEPIEYPNVSMEKFDDKEMILVANIEVMPEVTLGAYTGLEVEGYKEELNEEKVDKEVKQLLERQARFIETENAAKLGDFATINFEGFVDGKAFEGGKAENYRLELGSHTFINGFEDQIVGMKAGEEKDVNVTFPEDYQAENLKGKTAVFKVKLNKLEEKHIPELSDELIADTTEFATVEEYKADLRKHIQESIDARIKRENENRILDAVVKNAEVDICDCLVHRQLDMFVRDLEMRLSYQGIKLADYLKYLNTTEEKLREERTEQAKQTVKTRLVLEAILKKENIKVTDEELDAKLEEVATKYKKSLEDYKKSLGEKNILYFENELLMDKLFDFLRANNTIK